MERELKFRAWDGKRMIFFEGLTIGIENRYKNPYVFFTNDTFGGQVSLGKHEVMQFTGITDINGKEIYEGDMVLMEDQGDNTHKCQVEFKQGGFVVTWDNGFLMGEADLQLIGWAKDELNSIEVIGNIYQNPELITR